MNAEVNNPTERFKPPLWLRNTHVQTIGSSFFTRSPDIGAGRRIELLTSEAVRLEAFLHGEANPGRQVILIHGWLGCADSSYILSCLLYTSPSPRDQRGSRMPSSA